MKVGNLPPHLKALVLFRREACIILSASMFRHLQRLTRNVTRLHSIAIFLQLLLLAVGQFLVSISWMSLRMIISLVIMTSKMLTRLLTITVLLMLSVWKLWTGISRTLRRLTTSIARHLKIPVLRLSVSSILNGSISILAMLLSVRKNLTKKKVQTSYSAQQSLRCIPTRLRRKNGSVMMILRNVLRVKLSST